MNRKINNGLVIAGGVSILLSVFVSAAMGLWLTVIGLILITIGILAET